MNHLQARIYKLVNTSFLTSFVLTSEVKFNPLILANWSTTYLKEKTIVFGKTSVDKEL